MRELERDLPSPTRNRAASRIPALADRRRRPGRRLARRARPRRAGLEVRARRARRRGRRRRERRGRAALRPRRGDRRGAAERSPPPRRPPALRRPHQRRHRARRARRRAPSAAPRPSRCTRCRRFPTPTPTSPAARARSPAPTPRRSSLARALAERLGMRPFEVPEERPRRLPRRRRRSPRTSSSRSRSRPPSCSREAGVARRPRAARPARPAHGRQLVRARRRGAHRPDRARRRGDRRPPPRGARASARPSWSPLYEALAERTRASSPQRGARDEGRAHEGRAARRARRRRGAAARRSASCRRWAPCTTGHLALLARGPRALRRRRHEPVRQPGPVRPRRGPRRLPARRGARPRARREARASTSSTRRTSRRSTRTGFATTVEVGGGLTDVLDGDPARRGPEHFRGVTTVVAKLLNAVGPDSPSSARRTPSRRWSIRRMARDLDFPVEIVVVPTVREPDGLAMSSRNAYLARRARRGPRRSAGRSGRPRPPLPGRVEHRRGARGGARRARRRRDRARVPGGARRREPGAGESFNGRPVLVAVAARVGPARLIDNVVIGRSPATSRAADGGSERSRCRSSRGAARHDAQPAAARNRAQADDPAARSRR